MSLTAVNPAIATLSLLLAEPAATICATDLTNCAEELQHTPFPTPVNTLLTTFLELILRCNRCYCLLRLFLYRSCTKLLDLQIDEDERQTSGFVEIRPMWK